MSGKQVITVTATLLIVGCFRSSAQVKSPSDSTITFGSLGQLAAIELPAKPSPNAWGVDLLVSTNGFGLGGFEDRKSTRLNSSHGYISYAVFCLKKKNKQSYTGLLHKSIST